MVDWEPLKTQWEQDNSLTNWNYQAFIFEYNLQLFASNWHLTQHFEPRESKQMNLSKKNKNLNKTHMYLFSEVSRAYLSNAKT